MTVAKIDPIAREIFRIVIPLPTLAAKSVNVYVIRDKNRSLIIDTGSNGKECLEALHCGLNQLGVDFDKADIFLTHCHEDHMGLVDRISTSCKKIYLHPLELEAMRLFADIDAVMRHMVKHGYPRSCIQSVFDHFPVDHRGLRKRALLDFDHLYDGDRLAVGRIEMIALHTPGHSPGHSCLFAPEHKLLFGGDHVLLGISPGISCFTESGDPVASYLESLTKLKKLELDMILPGHRGLIHNPNDRMDQLLAHHSRRLEQCYSILRDKPLSAYEIASKLSWEIPFADWEAVPDDQKWHATSETIAHCQYLERKGRIRRLNYGDVVRFGMAQPWLKGVKF